MSLIADALKAAEAEKRSSSARGRDAARDVLGRTERRTPVQGAAEWLYRPIRFPRHVRIAGAIVGGAVVVSTTIVLLRPANGETGLDQLLNSTSGNALVSPSPADGPAAAHGRLQEPNPAAETHTDGEVQIVSAAVAGATAEDGRNATDQSRPNTRAASAFVNNSTAPSIRNASESAEAGPEPVRTPVESPAAILGQVAARPADERRQLSRNELRVEASTRPNGEVFAAAVSAQQSRNYLTAVTLYEQILLSDRSDVEVLNNLGVSYQALGQLEAAKDAFQRALALQPRYAAAWSNLGVVLNSLGQESEARTAFGEAIRQDPANLGTKVNLALLHQRQGLVGEAKRLLQEVLVANPSMAEAHFGIAGIFEAESNYSSALRHYRLFISTGGGRFPHLEPLVAERMRRLEGRN